MTAIEVTEAPCMQHERGEKCGTTWYSFSSHGETVGTCAPKGRKFKARVDEDKKSGQVTLTLEDQQGNSVAAVAVAKTS